MRQEKRIIPERHSLATKLGDLIVSVVAISISNKVALVIGRPGLPNLEVTLSLGGAALFETPDGLFEVRLMKVSVKGADILISQIAPRPGIFGGLVDQEPDNSHFTPEELGKIGTSLEQIRFAMSQRRDVTPEQLSYISRKLDEMKAASERLGRKDWMNWVLGVLTSVVVVAAFQPDVARALFKATSTALSWLFGEGMKLLP